MTETDLVDSMIGADPGSRLDLLRAARPEVKLRTQSSTDALFNPVEADGLTDAERFAVALRLVILNRSDVLADHYRERLATTADGAAFLAALDGEALDRLDNRQIAILRHANLLALRPAEAREDDLHILEDAGLSTVAIVTLAQIVAFVNYQLRSVFALQLLRAPQ
jgi:CMD domain protein